MVTRLAGVPSRLARMALGWLGGILVIAALVWWAALFPSVVANTGLTFLEAAPCLASNSQLCELATALCGGPHLFGIASYSPTLFWCGVVLLSVSLLAGGISPPARR